MTKKLVRLACGLGVWSWFTACAVQRSPEPNAPAASAAAPTAAAEERDTAESQAALPAPAPAAATDALDAQKSKGARDEAEFGDLASAERALHQAKAELDRLALAEPPPAVAANSEQRAGAKKDSQPPRAPSTAGAPTPVKSSAVCESACRAFSSLSRAASAVCRLDGSNGTHCSQAKRILAESQQRVASCSCPASSD